MIAHFLTADSIHLTHGADIFFYIRAIRTGFRHVMEITCQVHLLTALIFDLPHLPQTLTQTTPNLLVMVQVESNFFPVLLTSQRVDASRTTSNDVFKNGILNPWPSRTSLASLSAKADWWLF